jgi:hypothetical protein
MHLLCVVLSCILPLAGQEQEPVVYMASVSVHTVERGNMPVFQAASGSLTSLEPPTAAVTFPSGPQQCEPGWTAKVVIDAPRAVAGKVARSSPSGGCELEISGPVPPGATIGKRVDALVQVRELKDVVFFARPADSSPNSIGTLFVIEPGAGYARRVSVRYGAMSGPMIQVLDGLAPGDRVIVTSMTKWSKYPRVRLQ